MILYNISFDATYNKYNYCVKYNYLKLGMMNDKNNKNDNKIEPVVGRWVYYYLYDVKYSSRKWLYESGSV